MWSDLAFPWRVCLEEAWEAWKGGSEPIGAAVIDEKGELVSRGRNRIHDEQIPRDQIGNHALAHAEINAILAVPEQADQRACSLFSLLEPCPLCVGAIYMSGIRKAYFAACDPFAGSADLIGKNAYMSRKPVRIRKWENEELERFVAALHVACALEHGADRSHPVVEAFERSNKENTDFGVFVHESDWLMAMKDQQANAKSVYENLIFVFHEKFKKGLR